MACKFLSKDPYYDNVYKVPETRYLCRCVARNNTTTAFSERFVGDTDCESCQFYQEA